MVEGVILLTPNQPNVGFTMTTREDFRKSFVARLSQACEESSNVPPPHKGRQQYLAKEVEVAPEAGSKWFKAVSMPRPEKLEKLAQLLQVDRSWLAFGANPELDRTQRKAHGRELEGAVHLVMGMIMLAGGHCGTPSDTDSRASYVDFYATIRGSVHPIHISLARKVLNDEYELMVPKEFKDVRSIGVISLGSGKYDFVDLPSAMIEEHKVRKTGQFALQLTRIDPHKYATNGVVWPKYRNFSDLG